MITQEQLKKLQSSGLKPSQIAQVVKAGGGVGVQREGVSKWLFGDKTSVPGMALEAGSNILNLPSYAIGGVLNQGQRIMGSKYGQETDANGLGILEGIKNKRAVFTEAPETLGIDPKSNAGMAVGFAGELLTPGLPFSKAAGAAKNVFRGGKAVSRLGKPGVFTKVGGVVKDAGETLLLKSYKLNASDINKIADSIGVTNEAEKATKVLQYLEGLGLKGSTKGSARALDSIAEVAQKAYDKMVRTGSAVDRQLYIDALFKQASELEKTAGDPNSRMIVERLLDEAERQSAFLKHKVPMTDKFLTNTKTKAFESATPGQISNPYETGFNEQVGRAGVQALENYAPGSSEVGTKLRGLRTAQGVVGKQARTGLGTQLINAFKPGALGFGVGAAAGYSQGDNPLTSGLLGAVGTTVASSPQFLNLAGKTLSGNVSPSVSKGFGAGMKYTAKVPVTAGRIAGANLTSPTREQQSTRLPSTRPQVGTRNTLVSSPGSTTSATYKPSIPSTAVSSTKPLKYNPPKNVFSNKSTFGNTRKVSRGSFY